MRTRSSSSAEDDVSPAETDGDATRSRTGSDIWFATAVLMVAGFLYVLRRPDELRSPYVWAEESHTIAYWLEHGLSAVIHPLNGQLILSSAGLLVVAAELSWRHLPWISYALMFATFIATCALVLLPRSRWCSKRWRAAIVLYLAVVPIDPETYGVLLYSFWWTALWPFLILGWSTESNRWRLPLLVVAGLSSLAASGLFFVYFIVGFHRRSKSTIACGAALLGCFVVQVITYATSTRADAPTSAVDSFRQFFLTFADFVFRGIAGPGTSGYRAIAGAILLGSGLTAVWFAKNRDDLLSMWACGIWFTLLSAIPAPLIADPLLAGPRYYFLPYVAFGTILIVQMSQSRHRWLSVALAAVLALSLTPLPEALVRRSDRYDWSEEIRACANSTEDVHNVPVHLDGTIPSPWVLTMDTDRCRSLLD